MTDLAQVALRPPEVVMRLERMGSFFPTRLSFMRSLLRTLNSEGAVVTRPVWEMDDDGFGRAVYSVDVSGYTYSLVAFSTQLDPENRTDRVIAEAWDSSYVLFNGTPTVEDLDRLEANAPVQEAGRFLPTDLVLSRANKSVRLFGHVVDSLAAGHQPDEELVASTGYLMRTTAVYGNGKFGIADRTQLLDRPGMDHPFRAEMLTVWLIRGFTQDLVEHIAQRKSPETAVQLSEQNRRYLGIGNSTGLGMAPFLVSHPILINNWMLVRETALARVRAIETASEVSKEAVNKLVDRLVTHCQQWNVADERQMARITKLRTELEELRALVTTNWLSESSPWDRLVDHSSVWSTECQELVVALVLEPHGELVDGLAECMSSPIEPRVEPAMTVGELKALVAQHFDWAIGVDYQDPAESAQFWYVSEEKLEPRLGNRYSEPGAELEQPLDVARRVDALVGDLATVTESQLVAQFLLDCPQHRFAVRRVQTAARHPYGEIRDNLISERCLPIDMLRSKLSFFGASKFDPKSDRWTRISLYQGAPTFSEIQAENADDWWMGAFS